MIKTTRSFDSDFAALPSEVKNTALKKLEIYRKNPCYPSLRVKKMEGTKNVWELRVTKNYRLTFQIEKNIMTLRRIGTHDILKTP